MKVIRSDSSGIYAFQKIFKNIFSNGSKVVIWQSLPETHEKRSFLSRLNSFHSDIGVLNFELPKESLIESDLPLFCYCEEGFLIFKSSIKEARERVFSVFVPEEIKLLEEGEVDEIKASIGVDLSGVWEDKRFERNTQKNFNSIKPMSERTQRDKDFLNRELDLLTLDEEDKLFADKRESPRARPKIDKWVSLLTENADGPHLYRLFDLSRGGLGFITMELNLFPVDTKITVLGFDDFNLDYPLFAEVKSHRPVDELEIEYKVGCKFDNGQS